MTRKQANKLANKANFKLKVSFTNTALSQRRASFSARSVQVFLLGEVDQSAKALKESIAKTATLLYQIWCWMDEVVIAWYYWSNIFFCNFGQCAKLLFLKKKANVYEILIKENTMNNFHILQWVDKLSSSKLLNGFGCNCSQNNFWWVFTFRTT